MCPDAALSFVVHVYHQHVSHFHCWTRHQEVFGVVAERDEVVWLLLWEAVGGDDVDDLHRQEVHQIDAVGQCHYHFLEANLDCEDIGLEGGVRDDVVAAWMEGGLLSSKTAMRLAINEEFSNPTRASRLLRSTISTI